MKIRKEKLTDYAVILVVIVLGFLLLGMKNEVSDGIKKGLGICGNILIPSLFPFMALSSFAVKSGVFEGLDKIAGPLIEKVFRLPAQCLPALFFGFVGGYPVGANIISELYDKGVISENDARHMLSFCVNPGPAFVITAVGGMILGSEEAGKIMLFSVCMSSLVTGLVYGLFRKKPMRAERCVYGKRNISQSVVDAALASSKGIFSVCVWVLLFAAFSGVVTPFIKNEKLLYVFKAFSEVTTGIESSAKLGGIAFVSAVIAFGGLCVMCQILPTIKKCGIKAYEYLGFRIINALLSFFITKIVLLFTDIPVGVFSDAGEYIWSYSAPSSAMLLITGAVLIFDVSSKQTEKLKLWDITG